MYGRVTGYMHESLVNAFLVIVIIWMSFSSILLPHGHIFLDPNSKRLQTLDELVAQTLDTRVEVVKVLRGPSCAVSARHGISTREGNVENIESVVAVVAVHLGAEASGGEGNAGLANHGRGRVVAVGVTPDAVELLFLMCQQRWGGKGRR